MKKLLFFVLLTSFVLPIYPTTDESSEFSGKEIATKGISIVAASNLTGLFIWCLSKTGQAIFNYKEGSVHDWLAAIIGTFFFVSHVSYPFGKKIYNALGPKNLTQSSDAAISDEQTQPAPHHP